MDRWAGSEKETNGVFKLSPHKQGVTGNFLRNQSTQADWDSRAS